MTINEKDIQRIGIGKALYLAMTLRISHFIEEISAKIINIEIKYTIYIINKIKYI
jgi:hypothetical protein